MENGRMVRFIEGMEHWEGVSVALFLVSNVTVRYPSTLFLIIIIFSRCTRIQVFDMLWERVVIFEHQSAGSVDTSNNQPSGGDVS